MYLADQDIHITNVITDATAATTQLTSASTIDMQAHGGFDGVLFIAHMSAAGSNTQVLTVQDSADDSTYTAITGATATSTTSAFKILIVDIYRPRYRYLQCTLDRGTSAFAGVMAIKYRAKSRPTTNTVTAVVTRLISPTGTA